MSLQFLLTSDALESLQLDVAPDGWAGMKFLSERSQQNWGTEFSMSSDLTFWKQGAAYLRTLYEGGTDTEGAAIAGQGIEAIAVLNVFEKDPNNYINQLVYRGQIDFTTYRSSEQGVKANLRELGAAIGLRTRADVAIDLLPSTLYATSIGGVLLPALAPATVQLHSQVLRLEYAATQETDNDLSPGLMFGDEDNESHEQLLYFGFGTQGVNDLGLEPFGGGFVAGSAQTVSPLLPIGFSGRLEVALDLRTRVEAHNNGEGPEFETVEGDAYLKLVRKNGTVEAQRLVPDFYQGNLRGDFAADLLTGVKTYSFDVQPGDSLQLYARYFVHDIGGAGTSIRYRTAITAKMLAGSSLRITAESTTAETPCRGLYVHEALKRMVESMTDGQMGFYSEYYGRPDCLPAYAQDGPGALRLLTNGFGLRGFPLPIDAVVRGTNDTDPRKPLTASFQSLYNSLDAIDCLGAGIEQRNGKPTLRIEPRSFFFQDTEVVALGTVSGLVKAPYPSLQYSQVEVGYQHWQSGAQVGLDESNGQRAYTTPLTQQKATYSILSEANTAGYLIEEARRQQYVLGTNKEGQADQELFLISLRRTPAGLVTEKSEAFSRVSGILSPSTTYNLRLTPARNLRRHGFWLRAGLAPQAAAGKKLLRGEVQGNDKLVTQLLTESEPVDEHADVPLSELAAPRFAAETYEFTAKLRRHQVRALARSPYGQVSFLDRSGTRKRGYLLKMECEPASGQASFTLLRIPS